MPVFDIEVGSGEIVVPDLSDLNFILDIEEIPVQIAGDYVQEDVDDDGIFSQYTSATIRYDAQMIITPTGSRDGFRYWFSSSDNSIATVDPITGYVTAVGTGNVSILGNTTTLSRKKNHYAHTEVGSTTNFVFDRYVSGTLGESLFDATIDILNNTTSRQMNLFTSLNHGTSTYVRNTNVWTNPLDWSGVEVWNSSTGTGRGSCTLVSPRHAIMANHNALPNGTTVRFVDNSNNVVERTISSYVVIPNTDIRVVVLNSDVPGSISFYKVFPSDWNDYLKYRENIGIVVSDQENKAICRDWRTQKNYSGQGIIHYLCGQSPKSDVTENIIVGDSSSPAFAVLNGEFIFLGTHWGSSSFRFVSYYHTEINAAMTTLGGGYQLTDVDLSGFPTF